MPPVESGGTAPSWQFFPNPRKCDLVPCGKDPTEAKLGSPRKIHSPTDPSHKLKPRPTTAQGIDRGNLGVDERITADSAPKGKGLSEGPPIAKRAAVAGVVGLPRLFSYVVYAPNGSSLV